MGDKQLYSVAVSSLIVNKIPSERSKVYITRNTIVEKLGKTKQYKKETWDLIQTVTMPVISGYVNSKYLNKI